MLYRDRENGMLLGVCAGLAERFELNVLGVRIVAVVALICFAFWPVAIVYLAFGLLLRDRPLYYCGPDRERSFWRSAERESE
jgi:phage shock protein C